MSQLTEADRAQAVTFNKAQKYDDKVIRIVQKEVNTHVDGDIGRNTATAIHKWQGEPPRKPIKPTTEQENRRMPVQDGMLGLRSLGLMATELRMKGAHSDAKILVDVLEAELRKGNTRWQQFKSEHPRQTAKSTAALLNAQRPFAVILGCMDSRVPPELIFDQGLGDLFVVRSAGQVLDRAVRGSIQYALTDVGTPLVIVLGHEKCGAVKAANVGKPPHQCAGDLGWLATQIKAPVTEEQNAKNVRDKLIQEFRACTEPDVQLGHVRVLAALYTLKTRSVAILP